MSQITRVTQATLRGAQLAIPIAERVLDVFRPDRTVQVEWRAPNTIQLELLWGAIKITRGEVRTFIIQGKPAFCAAVIADLQLNGQVIKQLTGS